MVEKEAVSLMNPNPITWDKVFDHWIGNKELGFDPYS